MQKYSFNVNTYLAVGAMLLGVLLIDTMGIIIKSLGDFYSTTQLLVFRNVFAIIPLIILILFSQDDSKIFKDLNKKFNKIFIILLIICIFNIFLYNYNNINVNNKETYMNANTSTSEEEKKNIKSTFKEEIILKNKNILQKCKVPHYYGSYNHPTDTPSDDCPLQIN